MVACGEKDELPCGERKSCLLVDRLCQEIKMKDLLASRTEDIPASGKKYIFAT